MDPYKCYYCEDPHIAYCDLIGHLVGKHPDLCLKYREAELNDKSGLVGYRTKSYDYIIPYEGEVFVTGDNRVGIYRNEDRSKKTKLNTPVKYDNSEKIVKTDVIESYMHDDVAELLSEMDIGSVINDSDSFQECTPDEISQLMKSIPAVLESLKDSGQLDTYKKWCNLILNGQFPKDNIGYLLFLDIVDWYSCTNTSQMRYIRPETREFWEVGYRLFKGKFLRFMGGPRNIGQIIEGSEEKGCCQASASKINFAIPSPQTMGKNKLTPIMPGIIEETISTLSYNMKSKVIKIGVDGKKIARGKGKLMGDIDCWGYESEPSLKDRMLRFETEQATIQEIIDIVQLLDESGKSVIPRIVLGDGDIVLKITQMIRLVSKRLHDLRTVIVRLNLGIEKFMILGDKTDKHWTKSKYVPVISSLKVSKYDIEKAIELALSFINQLCNILAIINESSHAYSIDHKVNLQNHSKYHQLKANIGIDDSTLVKQKSGHWHEIRKTAKVTGSTCNTALGLGKLKEQQAHFDRVVSGKEDTRQFSEEQTRNMAYGNAHEIDGIATVVCRVLPALYPTLEFYEEGCAKVSNNEQGSFLVVSPDGSLRTPNLSKPTMMFENKCKINRVYSTPVFYEIPKYYIPQLLCEMKAYGSEQLLFTCWSQESTTVFKVDFDNVLWRLMWEELNDIYGADKPRRPTKFSSQKHQMESMIRAFQSNNVEFIGEFPSCSVVSTPEDVYYDGHNYHTCSTTTPLEEYEVRCESVLKHMHGLKQWHEDVYKLCRTSATEILLFMANDMDRKYHMEMNNAHPIAYALKGSSLTNETFGFMLEQVIKKCQEKGLSVIATSSDGQWHKYGVRGKDNKPLTIYQTQRDLWNSQRKRPKPDILKEIRNTYKVNSIDDVSVTKRADGVLVVNGHISDRPLKIFNGTRVTFASPKESREDDNTRHDEDSVNGSLAETLNLVDTFGRGVQFISDESTCQSMNEIVNFNSNANDITVNTASGGFIQALFEDDDQFDSIPKERTNTDVQTYSVQYCNTVNESVLDNDSVQITDNTGHSINEHLDNVNNEQSGSCSAVVSSAFNILYEQTYYDNNNSVVNVNGNRVFDQNYTYDFVEQQPIPEVTQTENRPIDSICQNESSDISSTVYEYMLCKLQQSESSRNYMWREKSVTDFKYIIENKEQTCRQLQKKEIMLCTDELNERLSKGIKYFQSWNKGRLYDALASGISNTNQSGTENIRGKQRRRHNPQKLSKIASSLLNKIPKDTLATVLAQNKWQSHFDDWYSTCPVNNDLILNSETNKWFSMPSVDEHGVRFHFDDNCHILTCLRSKICTTGISGLRKAAWESAALSDSTQLNVAIVQECVDKQSVAFAKRVFGEDVEQFMRENDFEHEATFVCLIRRWFEAEDTSGIPATERCDRRLQLRQWLLRGLNFGVFPPKSQYIKGIPVITFEALLVHLERKLQIYQCLPNKTYNPRALGTQEVEQFFSTMRDLDPSGQGTPKPDDVPDIMATATYLDNIRMNPNRSFFMKTSRTAVYPDYTMEASGLEENVSSGMPVRDHFFDTEHRNRTKKKRKSGLISSPSQPAHGQTGVRQYHKCDESKILAHHRKGFSDFM